MPEPRTPQDLMPESESETTKSWPTATSPTPPRPVEAEPPPGRAPSPEEPGPSEPRPGRRKFSPVRKFILYAVLSAASLLIGVQIFNAVIMPAFVGHRDEVRVPDLTGKDVAAAEDILSRIGLTVGDTRQRYDPRPAGTIVDQHPGYGSLVKAGRTVAIIVSRGESGGIVPGLSGQTLRNAKLSLESAGLTLGEVLKVRSESVPREAIIATEPSAGSSAPKGTAVNLLISQGGSGVAWVMPDLKGRDVSEVEASLTAAGFTVQIEGRGGFLRSRRNVVDHIPAAGARLPAGSQVTLYTD